MLLKDGKKFEKEAAHCFQRPNTKQLELKY